MERSLIREKVRAPKPQETPEQKLARLEIKTRAYFERFFEQAFAEFLQDPTYELPNDRDLRGLFEDDDTSPIGESVHWLTVTDSCLRAFTSFCRKHSITDPKNILPFTERVTEDWMRWTPNILSETSLDALPQRALLHQEPCISDSLREKLVGESVYSLRFTEQEGSKLFNHLMGTTTSAEELLALIAYLTRIHRAAEQEDWSEGGATTIEDLLTAWKNQPDRSILLQQAAEVALETIRGHRVTNTYPVPSVFIIRQKDDEPTSGPRQIARDTGALLDAWGTPSEAFSLPERGSSTIPAIVDALHILQQAAHHPPKTLMAHLVFFKHVATVSPLIPSIQHPQGIRSLIKIAGEISLLQVKPHPQEQDRDRFEYLLERFNQEMPSALSKLPGYQLPKAYLDTLFSTVREQTGIPEHVAEPLANRLPGTIKQKLEATSLLRTLHAPIIYKNLEKQFGFSLIKLSLREQVRLGQWLVGVNEARSKNSIDIIKTYGVPAAQTFLACEQDVQHGDQILAFAQTAPKEVASRVFAKFADIANLVDTSAQDLASQFLRSPNEDTSIDVESVRRELIKRGARILTEAQKLIQKDPSGKELLAPLDRYKADTELFCSLIKSLIQTAQPLTLDLVKDLEMTSCTVSDMPEQERDDRRTAYRSIMEETWAGKGLHAMNTALAGLDAGFSQPQTTFYELRYQGHVAAFVRIDTHITPGEAPTYYAGSLNLHPKLQDSKLGTLFFQEVFARFDREHPDAVMRAHALASDTAVSQYLERFRFRIDGMEHDIEKDGSRTNWYTIIRRSGDTKTAKHVKRLTHTGSLLHTSSLFSWIKDKTAKGGLITSYTINKDTHAVSLTCAMPETKAPQTSPAAMQQSSHP